MPLGTLDRTPPPFFRQGPSAMSKLTLFSAVALFLMVADTRFKVTQPLRVVVATALRPVQWAVMQPVIWAQGGSQYLESLQSAQASEALSRQKLGLLSQRANQVEQLMLENTRLRQLLSLRERIAAPAQAAQVLYDAADPYARKVIINKGLTDGLVAGSPVIDESGVLGQVTRVYPSVSEVTLVTDRDQAPHQDQHVEDQQRPEDGRRHHPGGEPGRRLGQDHDGDDHGQQQGRDQEDLRDPDASVEELPKTR